MHGMAARRPKSAGGQQGMGIAGKQLPSPRTQQQPNSRDGRPVTTIEKEYVHNLQQQVYFLELECRYLRKQSQSDANAADPAKLAANSFLGPPEDPTEHVNLVELAQSLRVKADEIEHKYQEEVKKASSAAADYAEKSKVLSRRKETLETQIDGLKSKMEKSLQGLLKHKSQLATTMASVADNARDAEKRERSLMSQLSAAIEERMALGVRLSDVKSTIKDLEIDVMQFVGDAEHQEAAAAKAMEEATVKAEEAKAKRKELEDEMGILSATDEQELKKKLSALDSEMKTLKLEKEQVLSATSAMRTQIASVAQENARLEMKIIRQQQEVAEIEEKLMTPSALGQGAELRNTVEEKRAALQSKVDELDSTQAEIQEINSQIAVIQNAGEKEESKLFIMQRRLDDGNAMNNALQEDTLQLERENRSLQAALKDLSEESLGYESEMAKLLPKIATASVRLQALDDQCEQIGSAKLDLKEFEQIMASNVEVAEGIKKLGQTIGTSAY